MSPPLLQAGIPLPSETGGEETDLFARKMSWSLFELFSLCITVVSAVRNILPLSSQVQDVAPEFQEKTNVTVSSHKPGCFKAWMSEHFGATTRLLHLEVALECGVWL